MWAYQLSMAWAAIWLHRRMSILIILAISLGLAAALSTLTIVYRLGSDPQPSRSASMHAVLIDAWGPAEGDGFGSKGEPPDMLTYQDAMAMWTGAPVGKQVPMFATGAPITPSNPELAPFMQTARATSRDFFDVVDMKIIAGSTWSANDDEAGAAVALIGPELRLKLFGDADPIGQSLIFAGEAVKIIGVVEPLVSPIRFYDVTTGPIKNAEQLFIPLRYIINRELGNWGNTNCWKESEPGFAGKLAGECIWLEYWVGLSSAAEREQFQQYVDGYADAQRQLGRFPRTTDNNRVLPLTEFLSLQGVVPDDARLANAIGFAFLAIALINAIGLMLAKFLRNGRALAVHRALGASRYLLFRLHLIEAGLIGLLASVLGIVLTAATLMGLRKLSFTLEKIALLDLNLFAMLMLTALAGSLLAGVIPAWRVSHLQPSAALRSN